MTVPAAVIVLAAGQGTRMKSSLPKVLHPVAGRSMIGHALKAGEGLNPAHLVAVVRHQRELVEAEIKRVSPTAIIADQDEIPGTGRAVQCGLEELERQVGQIHGIVVVTSGDVPMLGTETLKDLVDAHIEQANVVTVLTSRVDDPTGYGRIIRDAGGRVTAIVEQRDATEEQALINEINAGIYAFDADYLRESLANVGTNNDQGEVYLTDVLAAAAPAGKRAGAMELLDEWQAQGCNDRVQLAELGAEFNRRICEKHMREGVSIIDPDSTWIGVDIEIGSDTTIWPGTVLRGATVIGSECEIGPSVTLDTAIVGNRAVIHNACVFNVSVAPDTMVTPFSVIGQSSRD